MKKMRVEFIKGEAWQGSRFVWTDQGASWFAGYLHLNDGGMPTKYDRNGILLPYFLRIQGIS
jgi:hypothetical protein